MLAFVATAGATALGTTAFAGHAPAQTATDPATTVAPPATGAPTTGVPTTTAPPGPTTTLARCDEPAPVAVVFTGTAVAVDRRTVTFTVDTVRAGAMPFPEAVVDYPDDARFLRLGEDYLVAAAADNEVQRLVSKVRARRGTPTHCVAADPIVTSRADGSAIDTGLLAGMSGNWTSAGWYLVAPLAVAIGVLTALSVLRRGAGWTGRAVWQAVSRRRSG